MRNFDDVVKQGNVTVSMPFQVGLPTGMYSFAAWSLPGGDSGDSSDSGAVGSRGLAGGGRGYRIATRWDYTNLPLHPTKNRCDNFNL